MKKLFAVLLALTLVLSMGTIAFAEGETLTWTGSITVKGTTTVPVNDKKFKAYKILDAEAVNEGDLDDGVIYSIPAGMQSFYNDLCGGEDGTATVSEVETYLNGESTDLQKFAVDALAVAKTAGVTVATAEGTEANTATFTGLEFGYYVIEDEATTSPVSALMLRTTSAEVTIKADKPSLEKKIDGDNDEDGTTNGKVDYNTATVGEVVPYVLTSKVPAMEGYTSYTYTVTDTFSDGLTFNNDVVITVGTKTLAKDTDYTVTTNGQVVTINFIDFIQYKTGDDVVIAYSAKVNENAVIGVEGNPNTAKLTYSNNPQENTTDDTIEDTVYTYLVNLVVNKTDEYDNVLSGATFELRDDEGNVLRTATSNDNGIVDFGVGLKDGETYVIVETDAPDGFNKAAEVEFTVTCTDPVAGAANYNCTWVSDNGAVTFVLTNGADVEDYFETTIVNKTGTLLPETGGIGTTIFYVVGGMLMLAAFVLLITKKRMASFA